MGKGYGRSWEDTVRGNNTRLWGIRHGCEYSLIGSKEGSEIKGQGHGEWGRCCEEGSEARKTAKPVLWTWLWASTEITTGQGKSRVVWAAGSVVCGVRREGDNAWGIE